MAAGICRGEQGLFDTTCDLLNCVNRRSRFRLQAHPPRLPLVNVSALIWILVAAGVVTLLVALLRQSAPKRRARAVRDLLDSADALEARLRTARGEIEAVVGEQGQDPIRQAMREMLRQRLWLRDHGREASLEQLAEVRTSIDAARNRIETQLDEIERARAPMA